MFSIVFIDDEPWTLDDLRSIIDWEEYGFSPVNAFLNPAEALKYIKEHKPDVVCTDIRMPDLSGLDLIAECRKFCPNTLFTVISAYAEFEYAQRAIKEGAFSYLLKPLMENDVQILANKMQETLTEKRTENIQQIIRTLTVEILLSAENVLHEGKDEQISDMIRGIQAVGVSDASLSKQLGGDWIRIYDDLFVGLLYQPALNHGCVLCGIRESNVNPPGISDEIYHALLDYFTLRFYDIPSGMLKSQEIGIEKEKKYKGLLLSAAKERNTHLISTLLHEIEDESLKNTVSIRSLTSFYNSILRTLLEQDTNSELRENFKLFNNAFQMYSVFRNYKVLFHSIFLLLSNIDIPDDGSASNDDLAALIVAYVDTHYAEPVTLESLSENYNISLSQISRYFKKQTGVSYITYLTQKRIRRACQLLSQTSFPITDISSMVGYSDYFYFAKKFKSIMKETPSEFRMRQNENQI